MPNIQEYVELVKLLIGESAKYFTLLLFAVLSIRLWRRQSKLSREKRPGNFSLACLSSALAVGTGYFFFCHSMSLMYSHFGMQAFHSYKLDPALLLFQDSLDYRKNADALGGKGLCLLWTGHDDGIYLLNEAKVLRKGKGSPFENYYEGLYFLYHDNITNAAPLLEAASTDPDFSWGVTKLFAMIQLDRGQPQEAAKLMQPFMQADVTEADQAYVMASLELANGKKGDAQALVDKFLSGDPNPFWKAKLEKLKTTIQQP
jgi:hypothetical protein